MLGEEVREWTDALEPIDEEGIGRDYRRRLAEGFFYKSFLHVAAAVDPGQVAPEHVSAAEPAGTAALHRGPGAHRVSRALSR